ncbi:hypothetical protein WS68_04190 [Burkholderia sp. TSV86]|nr:hypothetical protein WS68_04190 [Burkholderia sp. TSV86]
MSAQRRAIRPRPFSFKLFNHLPPSSVMFAVARLVSPFRIQSPAAVLQAICPAGHIARCVDMRNLAQAS